MKYIKQYESFDDNCQPKIGDYALAQIDNDYYEKYDKDYINNTIGEIVDIANSPNSGKHYFIKYDTEPPENTKIKFGKVMRNDYDDKYSYYKPFPINNIKFFAPTKEEIEAKIASIKYNL